MNLESTITVPAATGSVWDAIVIGAGPAGAITAERLATRGRHVLLLDAKKFPRQKVCGGCINELALNVLSKIGLRESIEKLATSQIDEYLLNSCGRSLTIKVHGGISISRTVFDAELVRAAIRSGASFLSGTTGRILPKSSLPRFDSPLSVENTEEFREVQLESAGISADRIRGRVVVIADGLARKSLQLTSELPVVTSRHSWIGLHTTFPAENYRCPKGQVQMLIGNAGYVGTVLIENQTVNLAAAVSPDELKRCGTPLAVISKIFESAIVLVPKQLANASWNGTGLLTKRSRHVAGDRVVLVGDAAAYVEPFTGEGVGQAMCGAVKLSDILLGSEAVWKPGMANAWNRQYRIGVARRQWICRGLAIGLHHPRVAEIAFRLAAIYPSIPQFVANRLGIV